MSIEKPNPGISVFRMQPEEGKIPQFVPGQFVFIHALDSEGRSVQKRPYSIASSPSAPYLEFCIRMVHGSLTSILEGMGIGAVVGIEGPMGHFTYAGERRAAFIAGGTGIAPIMSMLRDIAGKGTEGLFVLFYSVKTQEDIIYRKELAELERSNPGIKAVITLTKEERDGWVGECGRLSHEIISRHLPEAGDFSWWMCGPLEMIKSMKECVLGMGADAKKLKMEGWG
ncbi:MAG: FAD-binding oxidoreductase [Candidatus Micrarchaeota archaeon]